MFYGPPPCLLNTNLKYFWVFSEFLWLYGKLKESIKAGQATMNSKISPEESPEMLGIYNFSILLRLKLEKQHYFNQIWDSRI